jgi:hypothetical protein
MKLHRGCDVTPDGSGLLCRETRIRRADCRTDLQRRAHRPHDLLLAAFFWLRGIWFFFIVVGLASLLIVPLLVGDALLRFRKTN